MDITTRKSSTPGLWHMANLLGRAMGSIIDTIHPETVRLLPGDGQGGSDFGQRGPTMVPSTD